MLLPTGPIGSLLHGSMYLQVDLMTNVCHALLYTPSGEHFGIVPLEAMHCRLPVVAVNDAGPKESVADGITGFLCQVNFEISNI